MLISLWYLVLLLNNSLEGKHLKRWGTYINKLLYSIFGTSLKNIQILNNSLFNSFSKFPEMLISL